MDDRDCLENSCTLRGTVGSNPTLSVFNPDLGQGRVGRQLERPTQTPAVRLTSHLHQHRQWEDEGVFRYRDLNRLAKVGQHSSHFKEN